MLGQLRNLGPGGPELGIGHGAEGDCRFLDGDGQLGKFLLVLLAGWDGLRVQGFPIEIEEKDGLGLSCGLLVFAQAEIMFDQLGDVKVAGGSCFRLFIDLPPAGFGQRRRGEAVIGRAEGGAFRHQIFGQFGFDGDIERVSLKPGIEIRGPAASKDGKPALKGKSLGPFDPAEGEQGQVVDCLEPGKGIDRQGRGGMDGAEFTIQFAAVAAAEIRLELGQGDTVKQVVGRGGNIAPGVGCPGELLTQSALRGGLTSPVTSHPVYSLGGWMMPLYLTRISGVQSAGWMKLP